MNTKQLTIIFVLGALLLAGCTTPFPEIVFPDQENATGAEYSPPFKQGQTNTTKEEFATHLLSAQKVYLIEDLRNLSGYPMSKNNIMQCGVDYAGSPGLVGKTFTIFAFDDGEVCNTADGVMPISECYKLLEQAAKDQDSAIIWIERGDSPEFYSRGLLVRVNEAYVQGLCSINVVTPEGLEEMEEIVGEGSGINETAAPEAEVPGSNESNATDEIPPPGDSHTFP